MATSTNTKTVPTRIVSYLSRRKNPASTADVVNALSKAEINANSVRRALTNLAQEGQVQRHGMQKGQMTWLLG